MGLVASRPLMWDSSHEVRGNFEVVDFGSCVRISVIKAVMGKKEKENFS